MKLRLFVNRFSDQRPEVSEWSFPVRKSRTSSSPSFSSFIDPKLAELSLRKKLAQEELVRAIRKVRPRGGKKQEMELEAARRAYTRACDTFSKYLVSTAHRKLLAARSDTTKGGRKMKQHPIYLVVGVPGSGKTYVLDRVLEHFHCVRHDDYMHLGDGAYVEAICEAATTAGRPLVAEAPFSMSKTIAPLEDAGYEVVPVFIIEDLDVLTERYESDRGKPFPKQHVSRMKTYEKRAVELGAFAGTSDEVLAYLKSVGVGGAK